VPIRSRDTEQVALALKHYYEARHGETTSGNPANIGISEYSRENLTALLAHELDGLVSLREAPPLLVSAGGAD
jgi:hypothetical protein